MYTIVASGISAFGSFDMKPMVLNLFIRLPSMVSLLIHSMVTQNYKEVPNVAQGVLMVSVAACTEFESIIKTT